MIDSTHLKAHRTVASLSTRGTRSPAIGRTKGGRNSKLHMVSGGLGRPLTFFLSPGQMSDAKGALALMDALPPAKVLLGDKGYDADWFREALEDKGIAACIPARRGRKNPARHNRKLYKQRHRIENLFARLKDCMQQGDPGFNCAVSLRQAICERLALQQTKTRRCTPRPKSFPAEATSTCHSMYRPWTVVTTHLTDRREPIGAEET